VKECSSPIERVHFTMPTWLVGILEFLFSLGCIAALTGLAVASFHTVVIPGSILVGLALTFLCIPLYLALGGIAFFLPLLPLVGAGVGPHSVKHLNLHYPLIHTCRLLEEKIASLGHFCKKSLMAVKASF